MKRIGLAVLLILIAVLAWAVWPRPRGELGASLVVQAAPASAAGYALAEPGTHLVYPRDHGPHDDYQTEWWYYTGNLESESGEHFGYQLTFFRRALTPPAARAIRASDWAANQVYMAHFALTDVSGNRHESFEKLGRGAGGIAGAQVEPFQVWLEDWSVSADGPAAGQAPDRKPPEVLQAAAGDIALNLRLVDTKGPVLQGDQGYSQKGPEAGNASYYYSLTRIDTTGTVTVGDRTYAVAGLSWMDHEYSTSALGREQVGWDWFSIQLNNNTELMVAQLRGQNGSADTFSGGILVAAGGSTRKLRPQDFSLLPVDRWRSPRTGGDYPSGWRLTVPSAQLDLTVTPYIPDQEMRVSYVYWEGAVSVSGTSNGQAVTGNGYAELTGYAGSMQGQF